jgi:hypothetical protein
MRFQYVPLTKTLSAQPGPLNQRGFESRSRYQVLPLWQGTLEPIREVPHGRSVQIRLCLETAICSFLRSASNLLASFGAFVGKSLIGFLNHAPCRTSPSCSDIDEGSIK